MRAHLLLHAIAVKKHADRDSLAAFLNASAVEIDLALKEAVRGGRVVQIDGRHVLSPLAQFALAGEYSREYAALRNDAAVLEAYEAFERINTHLKGVITEWQTLDVGGSRIVNDHSDRDYDDKIITKIGDLHERAQPILRRFEIALPRISYYRRNLGIALEKAEDGEIEWISDVKLPSYHTLWFELHEDILRLLGRKRSE
jgi:hypothetical protein